MANVNRSRHKGLQFPAEHLLSLARLGSRVAAGNQERASWGVVKGAAGIRTRPQVFTQPVLRPSVCSLGIRF